MPINFNKVPTENPGGMLVPKGLYLAEVVKAQLKTPQPTQAKPIPGSYISIQWMLRNANGAKVGTFLDSISDSDSQYVLYKVGRFCLAMGLSLTGSMELRDLVKIVTPGKQVALEIDHRPDNRAPDDRTKDRAQVALFGSECYWPASEFKKLVQERNAGQLIPDETAPAAEGDDDNFEFTAEDGTTDGAVAPDAPAADDDPL
jgi:hypothetical protein